MEQSQHKEIDLEASVESYTIIKHLLPIVKYLDIFDEHNRLQMINLIKSSLSSSYIPFNYVTHFMKLLVHMESNNVDKPVLVQSDLLTNYCFRKRSVI